MEGHGDRKKSHPLKWSEVMKPKERGLGFVTKVVWKERIGLCYKSGCEVWGGKESSLEESDCGKYGVDGWGWVPKFVPRYKMSGI